MQQTKHCLNRAEESPKTLVRPQNYTYHQRKWFVFGGGGNKAGAGS